MECEFPTENSNLDEIKSLLQSAKTIAVVGLSPNEEKDSHKVSKYMQEKGYKIIPIYPKEDSILGEKVYRSLDEVKEQVDIVNVFRKPAVVPAIVQKIKQKGNIKAMWLQKGTVNNKASKDAKDIGVQVVQNRCTMVDHKMLFGE